jgi:thiosulfate/3-mercaptopyruvate sulfurtransferase
MIDKKEITFLSLSDTSLKIKKSKIIDMKVLESSDILGRTECSSFYVCSNKLEKYFSSLGIKPDAALVLYDNSYGIYAATLYVVLESMGHRNITILRGGLNDISKLDPNWKIYTNYLNELKKDSTKKSKIIQKINILKPHLLLQESTPISTVESNYTIIKTNPKYLQGRDALKKTVIQVQRDESNVSIIDACEMIDIVNGFSSHGVKSLSWKELIDKKKGHLKSNEELEKLFKRLRLSKNDNNYIYCMSGAQKAFYVMMALRELGYSKVKAFTGDWNTWVGDIDE